MANTIFSQVTIEPYEAQNWICDKIEAMREPERWGQATKILVESFYSEEELNAPYGSGKTEYPITEEGVNHSWLFDHVGCKWLEVGIDDDIRIESANYAPDGFLRKIYNLCKEKWEGVIVNCKWFDETETECGVTVVKDGIIAEDKTLLECDEICDPGYYVEGDEDISDVVEWLKSKDGEGQFIFDDMDEDECRDIFMQWKNEEKWDAILEAYKGMFSSCEEAIETEDFDFPIISCKKI